MADGTSQGNPSPDGGQAGSAANGGQGGDQSPKFVTEEQLNRAITARFADAFGKFEKKQNEALTASFGTLLKDSLQALRDELKPAAAGAGAAGAGGQGAGAGDLPNIENHPAFRGLKKQLDDQAEERRKERDQLSAEKSARRSAELRTKVSERLLKGGIDPKYIEQALGYVIDSARCVQWESDDPNAAIIWKDRTGDIDFESGATSFLKSEQAKIYLPPRGTSGSGDRGGGSPNANGKAGYQRGALGRSLVEDFAPGVAELRPGGG